MNDLGYFENQYSNSQNEEYNGLIKDINKNSDSPSSSSKSKEKKSKSSNSSDDQGGYNDYGLGKLFVPKGKLVIVNLGEKRLLRKQKISQIIEELTI